MKILVVVIVTVCILQVSFCKPTNTSTTPEPEVKPKSYPYHAIIRLSSFNKFLLCEGALMTKNFILTAAGCVHKYRFHPDHLEVVMGASSTENLNSDPKIQVRSISKIEIAPKWDASDQKLGDLALLKLKMPILGNQFVNAITFYDQVPSEKKTYNLVGYGPEEKLGAIPLIIRPQERCDQIVGQDFSFSGIFCMRKEGRNNNYGSEQHAGAPIADTDDSLNGIYGIWGTKYRGTCTSIRFYLDWINSVVRPGQARGTTSTDAPSTTSIN